MSRMSNASPTLPVPDPLLPITIRQAKPQDMALILSSWKRSAHSHDSVLPSGSFFVLMNSLCETIIDDGTPVLLVATPPDMPSVILGWVCAESNVHGSTLFWAYTKSSYRRSKVCKRLLDTALAITETEGAGPAKIAAFSDAKGKLGRFAPTLAKYGFVPATVSRALHMRSERA